MLFGGSFDFPGLCAGPACVQESGELWECWEKNFPGSLLVPFESEPACVV